MYAQSASDSARLSVEASGEYSPNNLNQQFYVPMIRVDTLLDELKLNKIKLLKIDVEGFELNVLESSLNKFNIIENIVIEILKPFNEFSAKEKRIFLLLSGSGFSLQDIYGRCLNNLSFHDPTLSYQYAHLPEFNLLARTNFV